MSQWKSLSFAPFNRQLLHECQVFGICAIELIPYPDLNKPQVNYSDCIEGFARRCHLGRSSSIASRPLCWPLHPRHQAWSDIHREQIRERGVEWGPRASLRGGERVNGREGRGQGSGDASLTESQGSFQRQLGIHTN